MHTIKIDASRTLGALDRNVFGGFAEHLGRCIYGGIFDEGSPLADSLGLRQDVLRELKRLRMPIIRYPGGNFVSGYRWMDGVGPRDERSARQELAWHSVESNRFGTDEFVQFCRQLGAEPYLAVNCGDGDMREARDWVEYCNGAQDTALARLRRRNGFEAPHRVRYWGIGNEVDGPWQMGMKTPAEYARAFTEFGKLMKMVDRDILLVASWTSGWFDDWVERGQLLLEQAANLVDYMAIHWYVGNRENDYYRYMALSELFEERLSATEGLIAAMRACRKIKRPIYLAVDEWNVWYRVRDNRLEEQYNLEDALVVALQLNAFIRHARSVKMANLAQIVNVIAPILTRPDGLLLQSIFFPLELYSQNAGPTALDVWWDGDTFQGGEQSGLRLLDVSSTLDEAARQVSLFVVNRSLDQPAETTLLLQEGSFRGRGMLHVVNGADPKAVNTFEDPTAVRVRAQSLEAEGQTLRLTFEPHSVTALTLPLA
jgi:alpha-N-arabinofuranosidase